MIDDRSSTHVQISITGYYRALSLAGGDGDVLGLGGEGSVDKLGHNGHGPSGAPEHDAQGKGHINDDLLLGGLGALLGDLKVAAAGVADPASNVKESEGGDLEISKKNIYLAHGCRKTSTRSSPPVEERGEERTRTSPVWP